MDGLFIQLLFDGDGYGRFFYFSWISCVVISIILHELGHGWAAIKLGDTTPIDLKRMTLSPMVHMGPLSIAVMLVTGIAWGAMPINPNRLRGRYGDAYVSAAGPAINLVLAIIGLLAAVIFLRIYGDLPDQGTPAKNAFDMIWLFGSLNVVLIIFNLVPAPPLDGSHILASFSRRYADLISSPGFQQVYFLPFIGAFIVASLSINPIMGGTLEIISLLSGVGVELNDW
ncbi:MAG: site-2 protease family protein [Pseudomonadota bacterium]